MEMLCNVIEKKFEKNLWIKGSCVGLQLWNKRYCGGQSIRWRKKMLQFYTWKNDVGFFVYMHLLYLKFFF